MSASLAEWRTASEGATVTSPMTQIKYRADIDGLRAVAVLAVVAFHACPAWLPGGFIGVDMFFVISGYLISGIIYKGQRENSFTYADFYARRVRRIFPALLAAVVLCLAYGWLVLLPAEFEQLGGHVAAGTVFLQNVAFWGESGYFDSTGSLKPLLHLWSLAVEEQIYLVFPPLVLLFLRMRWPIGTMLTILLAASFVANLLMAGRSVSADFYLTPFRAWEFLAGAILAWIHDRRGQAADGSLLSEITSWTGVATLAAGMAWIDQREPYPGWRAVVPMLGTILLIAAGRAASFNRFVLSLAPVVWVGLISYPLYLFHWPLISFVHIVEGAAPDPRHVAVAVALSVVLAVATYYGLERQVRHSRSRWTVPILLAGFLTVGAAGAGVWRGTISPQAPSREVTKVDEAIEEGQHQWEQYSAGFRRSSDRGIGVWRVGGTGRQTVFFGDSTMMMMAPRVEMLLKSESATSRGATFIVCGGLCPVPGAHHPTRQYHENLMPVLEDELRTNPAIDRVVISGLWKSHFANWTEWSIEGVSLGANAGRQKALASLSEFIGRLVASGKRVTLLMAMPQASQLAPKNMLTRSFFGSRTVAVTPLSVDDFQSMIAGSRLDDVAVAAEASGAMVIDPLPFLCRDGICISTDEFGPIRYDDLHLRAAFVRDHVTYLDATVSDDPAADRVPGATPPGRWAERSAARMPARWNLVAHGSARATLTSDPEGAMKVDIERIGDGKPWQIQLRGPTVAIRATRRYTVSFRARAARPRTVVVTVTVDRAPWESAGLFQKATLGDEWQDVRFDFEGSIDEDACLLRFNLAASDVTCEFADVVIGPADGP